MPTRITYAQLRSLGVSRARIDAAVAGGALIRVRRGTYVAGGCPADFLAAIRHGGRLDCLSLLVAMGVFVVGTSALHVQMDYGTTRVPVRRDGVLRHWRCTTASRDALAAPLVEALAQACRCQQPRAAIATLDSAWHQRLVDEADIAEVFRLLPQRFGILRAHLDRRAESGIETLVRLMLAAQGWRVEVQVTITGVGRVDLVVDGWLIIECDSARHHGGWDEGRRDRRRDLQAARQGYVTLRPIAEDVLHRPDEVLTAIRDAVAHRTALLADARRPAVASR
ncbi:type IV toxin-antitoxin system AbiEi family antitoxin domain-containing protein [Microbacterium sp. Sa4CUA7]|uniref:Type IV toxin-antitoxin system AbiEi family antitoxin domain-containing protein n=1 Tax=Microbacterium pullorum TaxID=2762236 RepID=A0ABR8S1C3_9MICO|nr:type IV toxin-antitoxin system AbiEi family antitoxin domain-containing protein [Microbacterium pullorum]